MRWRERLAAVAAMLAAASSAGPARADAACGGAVPCATPHGVYAVALPPGDGGGALPALVFFHGYGGSGRGAIADPTIVGPAIARGYAVIAPEGLSGPDGQRSNWSAPGSAETGRDDVAFAREVVADATRRFGLDPARVLISGFSKGGSFVWHLACTEGRRYAAYAPVAGSFWRPLPEDCPGGPVDLWHLHGFVDPTVPLEGRPVGGGRYVQGDTFAALALLRRVDRCADDKPDRFLKDGAFACRQWEDCAGGAEIRFCLHDGGHVLPAGWVDSALDWFEGLRDDD